MKWIRIFLLISTLTSRSKAEWQSKKTEQLNTNKPDFNCLAAVEDIAHAVIATQDGGFAVLGNTKSIDGDIETNPMKFLT